MPPGTGGACSSGVDRIMFVNTIYMLQEFASVNNSVLRIHSFDLKAGLKKGERGNEGSHVPPVTLLQPGI